MLVKIHKSYRQVVAICDSELLGKQFEQGEKILDVRESFFNGEEKNEKGIIEIMKGMAREDATFNIIGKESCNAALKAGIISKEGIMKVQGIPFALVLL
jgi:hypothetical protein